MFDAKTHWENIYSNNTPHKVSWYQESPRLSLQLIHNANIAHDAAIIDVGAGASHLVDSLLQQGYNNLSVLDISAHALNQAQKRLGESAKNIHWHEQDITRFKPEQLFTLWHDRAVFHFLTQAKDRENYKKVLHSALKPQCHLIIAAFAIGGPTKCSGLEIVQYDANKISDTLGASFELIEEKTETHVTPADIEQQFCYFRFIKQ